MNGMQQDHYHMQMAIEEAEKAAAKGEVPIGAVIVHQGEVIARAHNLRETTRNAVTHAELLAIQEACQKLGNWRLEETILYVTLEPCPMCAGAILQARVPRVVYGARDAKAGAVDSLYRLLNDERFNHQCEVTENVMAEECGGLLTRFFRTLRENKKKQKQAAMAENTQDNQE